MSSGFIKVIHQPAAIGPLTWECPANQCWQLLVGHVTFTTSATGGNRWLTFKIRSPDGHIVWDVHAGVKQGGSTTREYRFSTGGSVRETAFVDNDIILSMPSRSILLPHYTMTLSDDDTVDEANDTFGAHGMVMVTTGSNITLDKLI